MMTWISGKMTLISEMETPTPLFQQTRVEKLYYFSTNFLKTLHTWSSPPNATSDDRFFQNSFYFRFYGLFPVFICLICKKSQIRPIFTHYSFKWSVRLKHNSREKNFGLRSNFKFGVIKGQISDTAKSRQIIPQNEALGESFSQKLVSRSNEVIKGQKSRKKALKGQILARPIRLKESRKT